MLLPPVPVLALSILLVAASSAAGAAPITVYFTGTVHGDQSGVFAGQGDTVTGSLTYDLDLVPTANLSDLNTFSTSLPANAGFDWNSSITNGAATRTADDFSAELGFAKSHVFSIQDNPFLDEITFTGFGQVLVGVAPNNFIQYSWVLALDLRDFDPTPPVGVAPGSDNLTGQVVDLRQIDLGEFEIRNAALDITGPNPAPDGLPRTIVGQLEFRLDAFSATPIPEPGTALLVALGLLGCVRPWRRGAPSADRGSPGAPPVAPSPPRL